MRVWGGEGGGVVVVVYKSTIFEIIETRTFC